MYRLVLMREPDAGGLNSWPNALRAGTVTGAQMANTFVFSSEMTNRNLPNDQYVEILYNALMGRPSDPGGKASWTHFLNAGGSRQTVFALFVNSPEFGNICANHGIVRGSIS